MDLDDADIEILRLLQQDSRRSMRELARAVGVSTPTASAKVRGFEAKGALVGYSASVAPEALGEMVLFLLARARPSDAAAVAKKLAARSEVRVVHVLSGGRVAAFATLLDAGRQSEFLESLSKVQEIAALDAFPVLATEKRLPLAIVDRGAKLAVKCEFCGRRTKDDVVRVRFGSITHFVCCESCRAGFLERAERLSKLAGRGRIRSELKLVEG